MARTSEGYLNSLTKISEAITSDLYLEDILKLLVTLTASMIKAEICALWMLDKKTQELRLTATQALSSDYVKERSIKVGEGIIGLVAKEKNPIAILNVIEDKRYKETKLAKNEKLVSMLSVPMIVKHEVIGVISCYTTKEHKFTKKEIALFITVANQAAVAIQNTELMVKTKIIQEELESRKLVEKAKGIMMKERGLDEETSYRMIRKASMDKRVNMKEIANAIIIANELKN